jgi:hypothetical protein
MQQLGPQLGDGFMVASFVGVFATRGYIIGDDARAQVINGLFKLRLI